MWKKTKMAGHVILWWVWMSDFNWNVIRSSYWYWCLVLFFLSPFFLVSKCRERTDVVTPDEMPSYICKLPFPWRQHRHLLGVAAWRWVQACALHPNTAIPTPPPAACAGPGAAPAAPHRHRFAPAPSPSSPPSSVTMTTRCLACKRTSPRQPQRCQLPVDPRPARRRGGRSRHTPRCLLPPACPPSASSRMRWCCCWRRRRSSSGHWRWLTGSRKTVGSSAAALRLRWWRPEKLFASWTLMEESLGRWAVTDPRRPSYSAPVNHTETWSQTANERRRFRTFTFRLTAFDRLWCSASVGHKWKCWIKKKKKCNIMDILKLCWWYAYRVDTNIQTLLEWPPLHRLTVWKKRKKYLHAFIYKTRETLRQKETK